MPGCRIGYARSVGAVALLLVLAQAPTCAAPTAVLIGELGYDALLALDARQTIEGVRQGYVETNPLLGSHPSSGAVERHMLIAAAAHALISCLLPPRLRTSWQVSTIVVEGAVVAHNAYVGVRVNF
jgi:hypothetical protein